MPNILFTRPKSISLSVIALALAAATSQTTAQVITFEELSLGSIGDNSTAYGGGGYYWNGAGNPTPGSFASGGANFINNYDSGWGTWDGFAYSNTTDTTTAGFGNQYSSITGGGADDSSNYVVGYKTYATEWSITYSGAVDMTGGGLYATNTTYAYLALENGITGTFGAKKFGGDSGNDPDYFVLSITGWLGGASTGVVDFYLADFRFADNAFDYILDEWTFVDLTALGTVDKITFDLNSSDVGGFGMNTPAYVAIDNVSTIPEPSAFILLPCALLALASRRNRRQCNSPL